MPRERNRSGRRSNKNNNNQVQREDQGSGSGGVNPNLVELGSRRNLTSNQNTDKNSPPNLGTGGDSLTRYIEDSNYEAPVLPKNFNFGEVDSERYQYLKTIEKEMLNLDLSTQPEEKESLVRSIFLELEGNYLSTIISQECSRILQKVLLISDGYSVRKFLFQVLEKVDILVRHRFASHVLETILNLSNQIIHLELSQSKLVEKGGEGEVEVPSMTDLLLQFIQNLEPSLPQLLFDPFGSHIVRTLIQQLAHVQLSSEVVEHRSKNSKQYNLQHLLDIQTQHNFKLKVPTYYLEKFYVLLDLIKDSLSSVVMRNLCMNPIATPVYQLILSCLQKKKDTNQLDRWIQLVFENLPSLPDIQNQGPKLQDPFILKMVGDRVGSHTMEALVQHLNPNLFLKVYHLYFKNQLNRLSDVVTSNHVIQKLIANTPDLTTLKLIIEELQPSFQTMYRKKRLGILIQIVNLSNKLNLAGNELHKIVYNLLEVPKPHQTSADLFLSLLTLRTYKGYQSLQPEDQFKFELPGSLLTQAILQLSSESNSFLVNSMLKLNPNQLLTLAKHRITSPNLELFYQNPNLSLKVKNKLTQKLFRQFTELATDKFGSFVFDKIWVSCDLPTKESIATELLANQLQLQNNHFGKFVLRNCRLETFSTKRASWVLEVQKEVKDPSTLLEVFDDGAELKQLLNQPQPNKKRLRDLEVVQPDLEIHSLQQHQALIKQEEDDDEKEVDLNQIPGLHGQPQPIPSKPVPSGLQAIVLGLDQVENLDQNKQQPDEIKKKKEKKVKLTKEEKELKLKSLLKAQQIKKSKK